MSSFVKDDVVVYGKNGICKITEIKKMKFDKAQEREYYVLTPLNDKHATLFVPLDSQVLCSRIRKAMSKDEIDAILDSSKNGSICWIEDKKQRNEAFRGIISSGDQRQMLLLAQCLYLKKTEKEAAGRKLWASDEALLSTLEKMISQEISWSLNISQDQVGVYIRNRLNNA